LEEGSSTLTIITLDKDLPKLHVAQVGDSGYYILRFSNGQWQLIAQSDPGQTAFNTPYQLAKSPETGYLPEVALISDIDVQNGDLIIFGSDGLLDNVYLDTIIAMVGSSIRDGSHGDLDALAKLLADTAFMVSRDPYYYSPFALHANQNGLQFNGGKSDDITVIVGQIIIV
jgi:protein phosphatase PTC7